MLFIIFLPLFLALKSFHEDLVAFINFFEAPEKCVKITISVVFQDAWGGKG